MVISCVCSHFASARRPTDLPFVRMMFILLRAYIFLSCEIAEQQTKYRENVCRTKRMAANQPDDARSWGVGYPNLQLYFVAILLLFSRSQMCDPVALYPQFTIRITVWSGYLRASNASSNTQRSLLLHVPYVLAFFLRSVSISLHYSPP